MTVADYAKNLKERAKQQGLTGKEFERATIYSKEDYSRMMKAPIERVTLGFLVCLERILDS